MPARKSTATAATPIARKASPAKASPAKSAAKAATKKTSGAKTVVKAAAAKPSTAPAALPAATKTPATAKPKAKLVRDSFTMPKAEYAAIDALKQRAVKFQRPAKKSELLRAGIKALTAMSDAALLAALEAVPTIKTGRPNKR